jgi:hypothetical protein
MNKVVKQVAGAVVIIICIIVLSISQNMHEMLLNPLAIIDKLLYPDYDFSVIGDESGMYNRSLLSVKLHKEYLTSCGVMMGATAFMIGIGMSLFYDVGIYEGAGEQSISHEDKNYDISFGDLNYDNYFGANELIDTKKLNVISDSNLPTFGA